MYYIAIRRKVIFIRKHVEIVTFQYSNKALADLLDESRAKCALTRIGIASIENTHEKTHAKHNPNSNEVKKPLKTQTKYKFSSRYVLHKYTFLENTHTN